MAAAAPPGFRPSLHQHVDGVPGHPPLDRLQATALRDGPARSALGQIERLAWVPLPALLVLGTVLAGLDPYGSPASARLLLALNVVCLGTAGAAGTLLAALAYLAGGSPGLLFLGAGMLLWASGVVAGAAMLAAGIDEGVAVLALSALLAGVSHLVGASVLARGWRWPGLARRRAGLALVYLAALALTAGAVLAAQSGGLASFYRPGGAPSPVRQIVVMTASSLFAAGAAFAWLAYTRLEQRFLRWYAFGLGLVAAGLGALAVTPAVSGWTAWLGEATHYLGVVYVAIALGILVREVGGTGVSVPRGLAATLREVEIPARALLDAMTDAVVLVDGRGRLQYWNRTASSMFGYPSGQVFGVDAVALLRPTQHAEQIRERIRRVTPPRRGIQACEPTDVELRDARGERFWAEISAYSWCGVGGTQIFCIVRDVTDRKRAEEAVRGTLEQLDARVTERTLALTISHEALERARQLLEAVLQQAADGILAVDPSGKILLANRTVQQYATVESGMDFAGLLAAFGEVRDASGAPIPQAEWSLSRALRGERTAGREVRVVARDGREHALLTSAAPLRGQRQEILGAILTFTEVTRQKRVEEQLRTSLAEREMLVREVHHRVKNNLAMISSLLGLQAEAIQNPEGKAALEESCTRVHSLALLYEQLYRSLEQGRVRLGEYLRGLVGAFEQVHGVPVVVDLGGEDLSLDVDRIVPCGLVANELLTNALKHAFPGERPGEIGVSLRVTEARCELRVWDRGRGLPAGLRVEESRSLGLRLVHLLAAQLGATLAVDTSAGTTFTIVFPTRPPQDAA
jgi:PAS domain S-box-containing protein